MAKTLLVIDDSDTIREAIDLALTGEAWETIAATNGDEAAKALGEHRVDVILCDVSPGEEDGYDLCRSLRSSGTSNGTPVVLMGGSVNETAALSVGASSTLPKPFSSEQLLQILADTAERSDLFSQFEDVPEAPFSDPFGLTATDPEEFPLQSTALVGGDAEGEELEVIDLSDAGEYEDLELLEDLAPVELSPIPEPVETGNSEAGPEPLQASFETTSPFPGGETSETWQDEPDLGGAGTVGSDALSADTSQPDPTFDEESTAAGDREDFREEPIDLADLLGSDGGAAPWELPTASGDAAGSAPHPSPPPVTVSREQAAWEEEFNALDSEESAPVTPAPETSAGVWETPPESGEPQAFGDREIAADAFDADLSGGEDREPETEALTFEEATPSEWDEPLGLEESEISTDAFDADLLGGEEQTAESSEPDPEVVLWDVRTAGSTSQGDGLDEPAGIGGGDPFAQPEQATASPSGDVPPTASTAEVKPDAPTPATGSSFGNFAEPSPWASADSRPPGPFPGSGFEEDATTGLVDGIIESTAGVPPAADGGERAGAEADTEWSAIEIELAEDSLSAQDDTTAPEGEEPTDLAAEVAASAGKAVHEALERSLSAEQLAPLVAAAVERVAWEVVPQMAERLIRETIERLQQDPPGPMS